MSTDSPTPKGEAVKGGSRGPYDFAMFVAQSFGKALPVVVIVGLLAYGAWYSIRELRLLNTKLIEAERQTSEALIKKTQAEADAKGAADRAKYETLLEYSKQLTGLNAVSADVSKRLQDLVSGQVNNMKKTEELTTLLNEKAKEYQKLMEQASKDELEKLRTQIAEASKKMDELARAAALAGYNNIKTNIATELNRGSFVADQVLDLLGYTFENPEAEKQAIGDVADDKNNWQLRVAIAVQLFKKTSNTTYLHRARSLIEENKQLAQYTISRLLTRYGAFSKQQEIVVLPMIVGFVIDERFNKQFRDELLNSPVISSFNDVAQAVNKEAAVKLTKYVGARLIETSADNGSWCYQITSLLNLLGKFSNDAQLVYSHLALENPGGRENDRECIKRELDKAVSGHPPPPEMIERWRVR